MIQQQKDANIYKAYIEAKNKGTPIQDLCTSLKITRTTMHDAIKRVKFGNAKMILKELGEARCEILWRHKYQPMYLTFPKNRQRGTIEELKEMIRDMDNDRFPETLIAKCLGLNRSTVRHHLEK